MNFVTNLPIRSKLVGMIMIVTLSSLVLASGALITYDIRHAKQELIQEVSTLARLLGNRSTAALVFDDPTLARENLQALHESPHIAMACVYGLQGTHFAQYPATTETLPPCPTTPRSRQVATRFDEHYLHLDSPIRLDLEVVGYIYMRSELKPISERVRQQSYATLLIALLAGLAALLLSNRLQGLISTPLTELARTATTIEQEQNYSIRAQENGGDELGKLTRSFNAMLDTIEEQNLQLLEAKQNLESLVTSRTRELEDTNRELESFSYSVSHDLRAPLRSINGFSLAVLEQAGERLDTQSKDYLIRVRKASERMNDLIDALLTLSRTTRHSMHRTTVDASKIAAECVRELRDQQPDRDLQIQIQEGAKTYADPGLLRIALQNLLANAWKFTRKVEQPCVEFGTLQSEKGCAFFVKDNGAGFNMTYYDRLFGAFQRLHDKADFEGTGIGLATVARIVHRHGGEIWADGRPDQGATFYFTLGDAAPPQDTKEQRQTTTA